MLELGIAIGVTGAFQRFAIRLKAIAEFMEKFGDHTVAGLMSHLLQFLGQATNALASPSQRRLRIAAGHRLNKLFQVSFQCRVFVDGLLATTPWLADPLAGLPLGAV